MEEVEFGDKVREFLGDGNRQYLTGLKLGGERVMILVDGSASMLADTVVNAVRRAIWTTARRSSHQNGVGPCAPSEWLLAQLPPSSRFQVYIFNTEASRRNSAAKANGWMPPTLWIGKSGRGPAQLFTG